MNDEFVIRPARPQDCAVLLHLVKSLAQYEKLSHLVVATEERLRLELFAQPPVIEAVIGWQGESAVGFALFFQNFSTFLARRGLFLEDLFVEPAARGKGFGKALVAHLAQIAVARGCGRFEWAVLDWNQSAIDFYRSLGAELLPDWRIVRVSGEALGRLGARE